MSGLTETRSDPSITALHFSSQIATSISIAVENVAGWNVINRDEFSFSPLFNSTITRFSYKKFNFSINGFSVSFGKHGEMDSYEILNEMGLWDSPQVLEDESGKRERKATQYWKPKL